MGSIRRRFVSLLLMSLVVVSLTSWLLQIPATLSGYPQYTDVKQHSAIWPRVPEPTENRSQMAPPEVITVRPRHFRSELRVVQTKLGMPVEFAHGVPVLVWMFWGSANLTGTRGESAFLSHSHTCVCNLYDCFREWALQPDLGSNPTSSSSECDWHLDPAPEPE